MNNYVIKPSPANHYRDRIIAEHLMDYIEVVALSTRNKDIVKHYVSGKSYSQIAKEYNLSESRIPQIVHSYILHCLREIHK